MKGMGTTELVYDGVVGFVIMEKPRVEVASVVKNLEGKVNIMLGFDE